MTEKDLARFFAKVDYSGACWVWTAAKLTKGYGQFWVNGRILAHRASYEHFIGTIPADQEIDHLCCNPSCVNPTHLEAVPHLVNVRRGPALGRIHTVTTKAKMAQMRTAYWAEHAPTHCRHGHAFTPENTYVVTTSGHQHRACRTCKAEAGRRRYWKQKAIA